VVATPQRADDEAAQADLPTLADQKFVEIPADLAAFQGIPSAVPRAPQELVHTVVRGTALD
jgi:hypothetical protein